MGHFVLKLLFEPVFEHRHTRARTYTHTHSIDRLHHAAAIKSDR